MKITDTNQQKSMTIGASKVVIQDINLKNTKAVISILRDKIYTDKPKAAIMETVCNAVDEHKKYKVKRPVDIIITSKNLIVRDYAKGLDEHGVMKVFFQYMNSTKSDNNEDIGGYGIGAKAPSSYTNTWYVTSYHNSKKTMYMSVLDGDIGKTYKMMEQSCSEDNTGICVTIPIRSELSYLSDTHRFLELAADLRTMLCGVSDYDVVSCYYFDNSNVVDYDDFCKLSDKEKSTAKSYFNEKVKVACDLRDLLQDKEPSNRYIKHYIPGEILVYQYNARDYYYGSKSIFKSDFFSNKEIMAYDGDVCYGLKLDKRLIDKYDIHTRGTFLIFFFKRGELPIAPTREEIIISDRVMGLIESKLEKLKQSILDTMKEEFNRLYKEKYSVFYANYKSKLLSKFNILNSVLTNYSSFGGLSAINSSSNYIPKISSSFDVKYLANDDAIMKIIRPRYGSLSTGDSEIIFITTESDTGTKHKAYYRRELAVALKAYRNANNISTPSNIIISFVNSTKELKDHMDKLLGQNVKYIRENVEYYNIDTLAAYVPKRTVNRVETDDTAKNTKSTSRSTERFVQSVLHTNSNIKYLENDVKGKRILMIPATQLQTTCFWKNFMEDMNRGFDDKIAVLKWLFKFDDIVKVYKSDIKFWKSKGLILAPTSEAPSTVCPDEFKDMMVAALNDRKLCAVPAVLYQLKYIYPGHDFIKDHLGQYTDIQYGSNKKIPNSSFYAYDVVRVVNIINRSWFNAQIEAKEKQFIEAINNLDDISRGLLLDAMSIGCLSHYSTNICNYLECANFATQISKNSKLYIDKLIKNEATKASTVLQNLVKNIDIQFN